MQVDRHWPRASDWLKRCDTLAAGVDVTVVGIPLHVAALTPGNCHQAPAALRAALQRVSTYDLELDRDLAAIVARDVGDLAVESLAPAAALLPVVAGLEPLLRQARQAVLVLGGDNSVTRPAFHALWRQYPRAALLTLDAHLDLRDLDEGLTNGNPVRALLADGLAGASIVQIGIQSFANSKAYATIARTAGIRVISVTEARQRGLTKTVRESLEQLSRHADAIYVDVDLDVLDRSLAPGTSGARPGGLSLPELSAALLECGAHPKVRMVDFVEFDPTRDVAEITALSGALALLSFVSGLLSR